MFQVGEYVKDVITGELAYVTWVSPDMRELDVKYYKDTHVVFNAGITRFRRVRGWMRW